MDWRDAEMARQRAQQQRDDARFNESMRTQEAEKRAQWAAADRRAEANRKTIKAFEETTRRIQADQKFQDSLWTPDQSQNSGQGLGRTVGYGGGSKSGSGFGKLAGFAVLALILVAVFNGKHGSDSPLSGIFSSPKYTPALNNSTFTTANFLSRLKTRGCKKSDSFYNVCISAIQELESGKYTVLNCQYNGGMRRYAWSPEAPPNVNRYQEFDRNTIYGVDHIGVRQCSDMTDGFTSSD